MSTKAAKTTDRFFQDVFYSDFMTNFTSHPASGNLLRVTNGESEKQALKNLILTNVGERLYQPRIGGNINASLFEPMSNFAANDIRDQIQITIYNNEPRVRGINVSVKPNYDGNKYDVTIEFGVINQNKTEIFELTLARTR